MTDPEHTLGGDSSERGRRDWLEEDLSVSESVDDGFSEHPVVKLSLPPKDLGPREAFSSYKVASDEAFDV